MKMLKIWVDALGNQYKASYNRQDKTWTLVTRCYMPNDAQYDREWHRVPGVSPYDNLRTLETALQAAVGLFHWRTVKTNA